MGGNALAWIVVLGFIVVRALFLARRSWRVGDRDATDLLLGLTLGVLWLGHRGDPLMAYGFGVPNRVPWNTVLLLALCVGIIVNAATSHSKTIATFKRSEPAGRLHPYGSQWLPNAPFAVQAAAAPFFIAVHTLLEELVFRGFLLMDLTRRWPGLAPAWNLLQAGVFGLLHLLPVLFLPNIPFAYRAGSLLIPSVGSWIEGLFVLQTGSLWPAWAIHATVNAVTWQYSVPPVTSHRISYEPPQEGLVAAVRGVSKRYGAGSKTIHALTDFSLELRRGEILGLLGPNGAGKTTLVKTICGIASPDQGTVTHYSTSRTDHIGVLLEGSRALIGRLTGRENMEYFAGLRGVKADSGRAGRIQSLLEQFGLAPRALHQTRNNRANRAPLSEQES